MLPLKIRIAFVGLSPGDAHVREQVTATGWHWFFQAGLAVAEIDADGRVEHVVPQILASAKGLVPGAEPLRAHRDLVTIADIAARVGVSRQAVQHWSTGNRRTGQFPLPLDVVGDATKVWQWCDVNAWLDLNLQLGDGFRHPDTTQMAWIDEYIAHAKRSDHALLGAIARASVDTCVYETLGLKTLATWEPLADALALLFASRESGTTNQAWTQSTLQVLPAKRPPLGDQFATAA